MSESYSIEIPNEKLPTYRLVTLIVSIVNLSAYLYFLIKPAQAHSMSVVYVGLVLAAMAFLAIMLKRYGRQVPDSWPAAALIACGCIWCATGNWWPGLLLGAFAAMSVVTQKKPVIHFNQHQIRYPSFPEKKLQWAAVDFAILKDDILTIEMKDNHLMQFTLASHIAAQIDSQRFNEFCEACTRAANTEPVAQG